MKRIGYIIFNFFYYIFYIFLYFIPLNDQIVAIKSHEDGDEGNIEQITSFFHENSPNTKIIFIKKEDYTFKDNLFKKIINFFIKTPYNLSRSKTIFLDNIFLPFAYTKFKNEVNLVQLWHSSGTIKKFALDSEKGWIKSLAKKSTSKQTHLIIESEEILPYFKTAFNMEENKIYPIGTPRTDLFFNDSYKNHKIKRFYEEFNELKDKKLILYAPTFRDDDFLINNKEINNKEINTDEVNTEEINTEEINTEEINPEIFKILKYLDDEWILILKLHPKISKNFDLNTYLDKYSYMYSDKNLNKTSINKEIKNKIYDLSQYNSLNTLMFVSNTLITDYSSIIFEYSLLEKNIIFYPYDLKTFEKYSRGFYFNYDDFIPGKSIVEIEKMAEEIILNDKIEKIENTKNTENIEKTVINDRLNKKDKNIIKNFKNKYMKHSDGKSTQRLYDILTK